MVQFPSSGDNVYLAGSPPALSLGVCHRTLFLDVNHRRALVATSSQTTPAHILLGKARRAV